MQTYCLKCEKHTYSVCLEKLIIMTKVKTKGILRCADCLAHKSFLDKLKDKDDLEIIVPQFLIDQIL